MCPPAFGEPRFFRPPENLTRPSGARQAGRGPAPAAPAHLTPASAAWEDRPVSTGRKALVTAPFRGEGLDTLRGLVDDLVVDPWIDHSPIRLYNAEQVAERVAAEGANVLVVESDFVSGPVF